MPSVLSLLIKIASTFLIIIFLSIESWNLYASFNNAMRINLPVLILFWGRFALIAHFLEAIAASVYAHFQRKNAFITGIYIFLVGTVGLWEVMGENPLEKIFRKSA